jgi:hypothetical protein
MFTNYLSEAMQTIWHTFGMRSSTKMFYLIISLKHTGLSLDTLFVTETDNQLK